MRLYIRRGHRKEQVWKQRDLSETFAMEKAVSYNLTYDFTLDEFIDFMMIQSNVNEKIERGDFSVIVTVGTLLSIWRQISQIKYFGSPHVTEFPRSF